MCIGNKVGVRAMAHEQPAEHLAMPLSRLWIHAIGLPSQAST